MPLRIAWRCRRPSTESLWAAIADASKLPCIMEEVEAMKHMLGLFDSWRSLSLALLRGHTAGLETASDASLRCQGQTNAGKAQDLANERSSMSSEPQAQPSAAPTADAQPKKDSSASPTPQNEPEIDLGALEALDAVLTQDLAGDFEAAEASEQAVPPDESQGGSSRAAATQQAQLTPGDKHMLSLKTLSQLVKSAMSLELAIEELQADLLGALKQHRWRQRAAAALRPNSKLTGMHTLH